jgi:hypothetical protein
MNGPLADAEDVNDRSFDFEDDAVISHPQFPIVKEDGRTVLKAYSRAAASGLYKKIDLNPRAYPVLRWSWKIERTINYIWANSLSVGASVPNA